MSAPARIEPGLPSLVRTAAQKLASAETAAEVLDARDAASVAYDAAKSAARIARAKQAHDEIIGAVYRAQADALAIESAAKSRLADEYDAAQERGEVAASGQYSRSATEHLPTAADVGLTRKEIHEARIIRDAERDDPGIVRRTVDTLLEAGQEPTKAAGQCAITGNLIAENLNRIIHPSFLSVGCGKPTVAKAGESGSPLSGGGAS